MNESHLKYIDTFQKIIIAALMWLMALVVFIATMELVYILVKDIFFPLGGLEIEELLGFFGYILLVLIGVELLETFKSYELEKTVNVQIVFLVAMIAMARSIIIMELDLTSRETNMIGTAAIIAALSAGYYLIEKARQK
ncbi:MAG TPA: phosphate-starvation-inducible PsiE family protein [Methanotrichaceae archaeon]|nr:phosphate-starvation-inducible PsiE family protein [Methanotrichaceae archaeon]